MYGVLVNAAAVLVGGLIGLLLRGGISVRFKNIISQGLALCVLLIGILNAIKTADMMCVIVSIVLGALLGEALKIEQRLDKVGEFAQKRFAGSGDSRFSEGFVTATLLYCVGAMAVVGSLQAGLTGDASTLLAKSALDGVSSVIFASAMGPGVILSLVPLTIYQGGIALAAHIVGPVLSDPVINEMSAVGGLLIVALSLNMMELTKTRIRVANLLPAIFLPVAYLPLYQWITKALTGG
jgi:uncharacterized membrane protein YqgA involved in biofilm formation